MLAKLNTRSRAVVSSIVVGILLFIIISPTTKFIIEVVAPPSEVKNILVTQKDREIALAWEPNSEYDLSKYNIYLNGEIYAENNVDNLQSIVINLDNNVSYKVGIAAKDSAGSLSSISEFSVTPSESISSFQVNKFNASENYYNLIFITSLVVSVLMFVLNIWVLFFKLKGQALLSIAAFPSAIIFPYLLLVCSFIISINQPSNKFIFSVSAAVGAMVLTYLLTLTSNILNGSIKSQIPLEQAAKATQFIFSLISAYLVFIYVFGLNTGITLRLLFILPFIFYYTYSGVWMLKNLRIKEVITKSILVTLTMALSIIIISIWPVNTIYAILTCAIVYYILLNIGLENRVRLSFNYWVEYLILIGLVFILLTTTAVWGINGTLI
jgi:hypothetical protein